MTIELCLFDLDDTLLRTSDLELFRGGAHLGPQDQKYKPDLCTALDAITTRHLYTLASLVSLRAQFPKMKWGVFTRGKDKDPDQVFIG
jgi:hypothetical protein